MPFGLHSSNNPCLKIYRGYGHTHSLFVFGHLFLHKAVSRSALSNNLVGKLYYFARRYTSRTVSGAGVQLIWRNQIFETRTAKDGFFQFHWKSESGVEAGWHDVEIRLLASSGMSTKTFTGSIFVPHTTQFVFVSDIDDTIQISRSTHWGKKMAILLTSTPETRETVHQIGHLFEEFAHAHSSPAVPHPFFYISNSEWNLYDDLTETFRRNSLPKGVFLLNHLKRWFGLLDVGTAPGNTKIRRASRLLDTFARQKFVLIGDDSQKDPEVYASLVEKYQGRIYAVYLRQVGRSTLKNTNSCLDRMNQSGTFTCLFSTTSQALHHARNIGLL